jgi:hypothetical protein
MMTLNFLYYTLYIKADAFNFKASPSRTILTLEDFTCESWNLKAIIWFSTWNLITMALINLDFNSN